jgi:hypothetical protein
MQSGEHFLVALGQGRFFRSADGNVITTTLAPSDGHFLTYDAATSLVARLRRRGFPDSMVADLAGEPATFERLQEYRREAAVADDLPNTCDELDQMLVSDFRRRYSTESAFRQRADELEKQPRQPS